MNYPIHTADAMDEWETHSNVDAYQILAKRTAIYPEQFKLIYPALGLGEAGEFQGKVKKILRDNNGTLTPVVREALIAELGDIMWYIAACATDLNVDLSAVLSYNVNKLFDRQERGVLGGSGDNR